MEVLIENKLTSKIAAFYKDNTYINFGGLNREASTMFAQNYLSKNCNSFNCGAHITHCTIKTVTDSLPEDF